MTPPRFSSYATSHRRRILLAICSAGLLLCATGCPSSPKETEVTTAPESNESRPPLRVLVLDDGPMAKAIEQQWIERAADETIEVKEAKFADLGVAKRFSADIVVFPSRFLGEFAERDLIQPVPAAMVTGGDTGSEEAKPLPLEDLFPSIRQCDISWGRKVYAVPLGSPPLMLVYREDIFKKLSLSAPETWSEYQKTLEKLNDRSTLGDLAPPEGKHWQAGAEPLADGWAGNMLLARSAASVRTEGQLYSLFSVDKLEPRITTPPYVRALEELVAAAKTSGAKERMTPAQTRAALLEGECAMAITWLSAADKLDAKFSFAYAELPGSDDAYSFQESAWIKKTPDQSKRTTLCAVSGRLAAVTKEARRSSAAFQLLRWLTDSDVAREVSPASEATTLFAKSQRLAPEPWVNPGLSIDSAKQYASIVESALSHQQWMPTIRLPGSSQYLAHLDEAVVQVVNEKGTISEELEKTVKKWNEITRSFDLIKQRRAYQRSLGNDF